MLTLVVLSKKWRLLPLGNKLFGFVCCNMQAMFSPIRVLESFPNGGSGGLLFG